LEQFPGDPPGGAGWEDLIDTFDYRDDIGTNGKPAGWCHQTQPADRL
jgi:hypothetical protein